MFICEGQSQTTSVGINLQMILTHFSITYQVQSPLLWLIWERQWCRQKWYHTWADRPLILPLDSIIKSYVTYGLSWALLAAAKAQQYRHFYSWQAGFCLWSRKLFLHNIYGVGLQITRVIWWTMYTLVVQAFHSWISGRAISCFWHTTHCSRHTVI